MPHSTLRATQFHLLIDGLLSKAACVPLAMPLPADLKFQSVAESEVAESLAMCIASGPPGRLPDFGGPKVHSLGEMAEIWMDTKGVRKRVIPIPVPGALAAAFRGGKGTAPGGMRGVVGWHEWLVQRLQLEVVP